MVQIIGLKNGAHRRSFQFNFTTASLSLDNSIEFIDDETLNSNMMEGFWVIFNSCMNKQGTKKQKVKTY